MPGSGHSGSSEGSHGVGTIEGSKQKLTFHLRSANLPPPAPAPAPSPTPAPYLTESSALPGPQHNCSIPTEKNIQFLTRIWEVKKCPGWQSRRRQLGSGHPIYNLVPGWASGPEPLDQLPSAKGSQVLLLTGISFHVNFGHSGEASI